MQAAPSASITNIMDIRKAQQCASLVAALTDHKALGSQLLHTESCQAKLKELKRHLKSNDALVAYIHPVIMWWLAKEARRLSLELCEMLFSRSKCFRRLLAAEFRQFVQLTVGHKQECPLPAPPAGALALRERALELIEKWHEQWGLHYPQVTAAYTYLKKQYKFPQISSRRAAVAAAEAQRQQRHQQMLLQRYQAFSQDFPQQRQQLDDLLHQMQQCFDLLRQPVQPAQQQQVGSADVEHPGTDFNILSIGNGNDNANGIDTGADATVTDALGAGEEAQLLQDQEQQQQQQQQQPPAYAAFDNAAQEAEIGSAGTAGTVASADEEQDWEDVPLQQQQQQQQRLLPADMEASSAADGAEGAADPLCDAFDMDELVGDFQEPIPPDPDDTAFRATLLEQLADLARQAHLATSKQLLDWLRLLTQLQLTDPGQQQLRQQFLRAVVELRAQLQESLATAAAWGVQPTAVSKAGVEAQLQQQHIHPPQAAAAAAAVGEAVPSIAAGATDGCANNSSSSNSSGAVAALGALPSRSLQPPQLQQHASTQGIKSSNCHAGASITFGSNLLHMSLAQQRLQQQQQLQQGQPGGAALQQSRQYASRQLPPLQLQASAASAAAPVADAYANLRDPAAAAAVGDYIIPREVVLKHELARWSHQHPESPEDSTAAVAALGSKHQLQDQGLKSTDSHTPSSAAGRPGANAPEAGFGTPPETPENDTQNDTARPLDPGLRRKLLASAPQLSVSGQDWLMAHYGVTQHGMELYNHWGAVDAAATIPKDRLQQLVGYAATYYAPPTKKHKVLSAGGATSAVAAAASAPAPAAAAAVSAGAAAAAAAEERGRMKGLSRCSPHGGVMVTTDNSESTIQNKTVQQRGGDSGAARQQSTAAAAGDCGLPVAGATAEATAEKGKCSSISGQHKQKKRSQREEASAHNRAILAAAAMGTSLDEGVAAALQQQLNAEAAAADGSRKGRTKKPPEKKGDKVRKQLLGL